MNLHVDLYFIDIDVLKIWDFRYFNLLVLFMLFFVGIVVVSFVRIVVGLMVVRIVDACTCIIDVCTYY